MKVKLYNNSIEINFNAEYHTYSVNGHRSLGVTTALGVIDKSQGLLPWAIGLALDYVKEHRDMLESDPQEVYQQAQKQAETEKNVAADIGKQIHEWCEAYIKNQTLALPDNPKVLQGVMSFIDWAHERKVKFLSSERIVYSKEYDFIGTLDMEIEIDGKRYLGDIKTGNNLYPEVKLQLAAYLMADVEESKRIYAGRWALRVSKETEEEYYARLALKNTKRVARGLKEVEVPKYQVFEAVFLDQDPTSLADDFATFKSCLHLYRWKQKAVKLF